MVGRIDHLVEINYIGRRAKVKFNLHGIEGEGNLPKNEQERSRETVQFYTISHAEPGSRGYPRCTWWTMLVFSDL